jgi:hypothetical protein
MSRQGATSILMDDPDGERQESSELTRAYRKPRNQSCQPEPMYVLSAAIVLLTITIATTGYVLWTEIPSRSSHDVPNAPRAASLAAVGVPAPPNRQPQPDTSSTESIQVEQPRATNQAGEATQEHGT